MLNSFFLKNSASRRRRLVKNLAFGEPLMLWSNEVLSLTPNACEGELIMGTTGSGKTTGLGQTLSAKHLHPPQDAARSAKRQTRKERDNA